MSVSNDVNHVESPTAVISKTVVEEVQSANDGKYEEVDVGEIGGGCSAGYLGDRCYMLCNLCHSIF